MNGCVFCKIISAEVPSKKVYEDDDALAFWDINPKAPVHLLVVPKKHISKLAEAEDRHEKLLGKLQLICAKVAKDNKIGSAFRVINFSGEEAGQTVFHLHYHVMGGWKRKMTEDL